MKKHRPSLADKRRMQPDRTYKDLKQKHKAKIADWMFRAVCEYYTEHSEKIGRASCRERVFILV